MSFLPAPNPAQPVYVLRGHAAAIHSLDFIRANTRLVSGDADGWVVVWDTATKRPAAVWRAHENAVLRTAPWGWDRIMTHGRDQRLYVWQLGQQHEVLLSKMLPAEAQVPHRPQPWLLHALVVNTLNFCAFAMCRDVDAMSISRERDSPHPILVALPSALGSDGIDVWQLPSQRRLHTIPAERSITAGMVMAVGILSRGSDLAVAAGFESGHVLIFNHNGTTCHWQRAYAQKPHSQPVLSLSIAPSLDCIFTSSADATIAEHPLRPLEHNGDEKTIKTVQTRHAGQQGLSVRSDGKIFATAGWDSRARVYSTKSLKELAVLKWHKEGCYSTAFAQILDDDAPSATGNNEKQGAAMALVDLNGDGPLSTRSEQRRSDKARSTHWLAVGSKDGKVSLWDLY